MPHIRVNQARSVTWSTSTDITVQSVPGRDAVLAADASSSSPLIVTLPLASSAAGMELTVVNVGATGTVIVQRTSPDTLAGQTTINFDTQYEAVTFESLGGSPGWMYGGITTLELALDEAVFNAGFPSTTFIYNSTGDQIGTRYNSWADLMDAVALARYGGPRNIVFERDELLPSGTWDLTDITLLGNGVGIAAQPTQCIRVQLDDGFVLDPSMTRLTVSRGLVLESISTDPIINPNGSFYLVVDDGAAVGSQTDPFIYADNDGTVALAISVLGGNALFVGQSGVIAPGGAPEDDLGGYELIECDNTSATIVTAIAPSGYGNFDYNGLIRGTVDFNVVQEIAAQSLAEDFTTATKYPLTSITQPNLTASGSANQIISRSGAISYTPGNSSHWSGDPIEVAEALDRIAAAVYSGTTGAIA